MAQSRPYFVGLGILIRDDKGELLKAVEKQLEHWDNTQVKLEAIIYIKESVEPWMHETNRIIVERDNKSVIEALQGSMKDKL